MKAETANRLVQMRKQRGLSQEALADKLGVSRQAVSKWERAEASPDTDNLIMLAQLYGISLDELLDHKPDCESNIKYEDFPDYEPSGDASDDASQKSSADKKKTVSISFKGIEVNDEKEHVHIGWNGIIVDDKTGEHINICNDEECSKSAKRSHKYTPWRYGWITTMVIVLAYATVSVIWGIWHPAWLLFLLIPIIESGINAIRSKSPKRFAFPVFVTLIFLCLGFFLNAWHPGWLVFLTIPIFYSIPFGSYKNEFDGDDDPDDE